jgi:hypothetical protein
MENNNSKELYNLVKKVKADMHLEKARIVGQYVYNPEEFFNSNIDSYKISEMTNKQLILSLSEEILKNFSSQITTKVLENGYIESNLDLMVMPTNFFKELVERVISLTPMPIINDLKNI